jgi:hypothetical protein
MFGIEKERLVSNLKTLRLKLCAYSNGERDKWRCDCKYGKSAEDYNSPYSEVTGCPEIAMAFKILEVMTERQFATLCKKAKIV